MTILTSQDGQTFINLDKIVAIECRPESSPVDSWSKVFEGKLIAQYTIHIDCGYRREPVAVYTSEAQAKSVIEEIEYAIQNDLNYEMPEDKDVIS